MAEYGLDKNMTDAILAWYLLGLEPGSCCQAIIDNQYHEARLRAHTLLLLSKGLSKETVLDDTFFWFENHFGWFWTKKVSCHQWCRLGGYQNADQVIRMEHKLMIPKALEWSIERYEKARHRTSMDK